MKYLLLCLLLIGCAGQDGRSGANGLDGSNGSNGNDGTNGLNSVIKVLPILPGVNCLSGGILHSAGLDVNWNNLLDDTEIQHAAFVCNGTNGSNGTDGTNGVDGQNGTDGTNGTDGQTYVPSPFAPVDIIDPCGDTPGKYDEILIRLYNGMLIATISDNSNGLNTRLAIVPSGGWRTTDNTGCTFTVHSNGMVTW